MNPPGDADTDGSPSNCTAFFIITVHDLSLYETHSLRSPPHGDSLPFSSSTFIYSCPTVTIFTFFTPPPHTHSVQLTLSSFFSHLCFCPHISVSVWVFPLLLWSPPAHPHLSSLAGSLFSADVPLVSGGLAARQQKWLWDWGMAALSLAHRAILMNFQLHTYRVDSGATTQEEKQEAKLGATLKACTVMTLSHADPRCTSTNHN